MIFAVLLGSVLPLAALESRWGEAVAAREDAAVARALFRQLAGDCDRDWRERPRPQTARLRGQCHYLAGDLPAAVVAFREGLRRFPADAGLQRRLEFCRDEVASGSANPVVPRKEWRDRLSEWGAFGIALAAVSIITFGTARHLTARDRWALPLAASGLVALAALTLWHRQCQGEEARDLAAPASVLRYDAVLRTGNGDSYPPRLAALLPLGSEVREVGRRGGWVRIELETGESGWVPEGVLLKVE